MRGNARAFFIVVSLSAFVALVALAGAAYTELNTFAADGPNPGGSGSGPGQLSNPGQVDVNETSGRIYVADTANNRVEVFKPTATAAEYESEATVSAPSGLAIDQATGDVYVAGPAGISKFTASLAPIAVGWTDPAVTGALAVDPSNGDLLVADTAGDLVRRFASEGTPGATFAAERPIDIAVNSTGTLFVITSTGDLLGCATSAVERYSAAGVAEGAIGASLLAPSAVAVDPDDDAILVAANSNGYNCGGPDPAVADFDAAGGLKGSATLAGTQYATVPGLAAQGGTSGRAYVVTKSPANDSFGPTSAIVLENDTPAAPRVIGQTSSPTSDGAELRATINPRYAATEYRFEYGLTSAYGSSTPGKTIPAGGDELGIEAVVSGLQPDTTYHYRVVAQNSADTDTGPDRTFRTLAVSAGSDACPNASLRAGQGSAYLPECRAYEMVSPPDKNSGSVLWGVGGLPAVGLNATTAEGGKVAYTSYQPFPVSEHGQPQSYRANRSPAGWESIPVSPKPAAANPIQSERAQLLDATDDFSRWIFETRDSFNPLDQDVLPLPGFTIKFPDIYARNDGGPMEWFSRADADVPDSAFLEALYVGRSADAQTIYFRTPESLTPDAVPMVEGSSYLYARGPAGTRLINTDEGGVLLSQCGASLGTAFNGGSTSKNAVSANGQRAFFQVPDGGAPPLGLSDPSCLVPAQLYLRDGATVTNVSASQMTAPEPISSPARFQAATRDGSVVFFTSADRLTDDATVGGGLYAYDVESEALSFLSTGASGPGGAQVSGVVKSTDDGSHVYFIAKGELVAGEGVADSDNLYLWTGGSVRFIATLTAADATGMLGIEGERQARITPDGSSLVFVSRADQTDYEAEGASEVYLWREDGGQILCASCNPAGNPQSGNAQLLSAAAFYLPASEQHDSRNISVDGSRVFFETTDALVKADINGVIDVYWYSPGGVPRLISDGKSKYGSLFFDASAGGGDIFFSTQASLVAQDIDNGENDIYDARVEGGFAPSPAPPNCSGEACQGTSSAVPGERGLGSNSLNAPAAGKPAKPLARVSAKAVRKVVTVSARVSTGGALSASGPGLVASARTVKAAGTYALKLPLNRSGKARLRSRGALNIRVVVRFRTASGRSSQRSLSVKLVNANMGVRG